jgi:hypothetical protein
MPLAFVGRSACYPYELAVQQGYRFYSFGDAMLICEGYLVSFAFLTQYVGCKHLVQGA